MHQKDITKINYVLNTYQDYLDFKEKFSCKRRKQMNPYENSLKFLYNRRLFMSIINNFFPAKSFRMDCYRHALIPIIHHFNKTWEIFMLFPAFSSKRCAI